MNANRNGGAKMSVRNLRIREDTAKYLLNLDVNSAYYDPKTRSMRENPLPESEMHAKGFSGVNYNQMKQTGDARELASMQLYEMEAYEKGQNLHLQADPTTAEMMNKIYREKKGKLKDSKVNSVLEKYGGQEHMERPPDELLFAQTEEYAEYNRSGNLVEGKKKGVVKSKYEEDIHSNNHTEIWGSFFDRQSFRWGYADDLNTTRNAYGTGAAGKYARQLAQQASKMPPPPPPQSAGGGGSSSTSLLESARSSSMPQSQMYGTGEQLEGAALDQEKVRRYMREQREKEAAESREGGGKGGGSGGGGGSFDFERKRKYNSALGGGSATGETNAEEMEAYHRSKHRSDDPMAQMLAEADTDDEA